MHEAADAQKQQEQRAGIAEFASSLRRAFDRLLSPTGQTTEDLAAELKSTQDAFEMVSAENAGLVQRIEDLTRANASTINGQKRKIRKLESMLLEAAEDAATPEVRNAAYVFAVMRVMRTSYLRKPVGPEELVELDEIAEQERICRATLKDAPFAVRWALIKADLRKLGYIWRPGYVPTALAQAYAERGPNFPAVGTSASAGANVLPFRRRNVGPKPL